jgi:hypothetical protein
MDTGPVSGGPGLGILMRWTGHTDNPISGWQPKTGWNPFGAIGWWRWSDLSSAKLELYETGVSEDFVPALEVRYIFKMRVESVAGQGGLYSLKVWEDGQLEPSAWNLIYQAGSSNLANGSFMLLAHHVDASFGDVTVTPGPFDDTVPPVISTQPEDRIVTVGQTATFSVVAEGTEPLSYQWQKNGGDIPGATSASYTTPATTLTDDGATFRCVVTNSAGSATSNEARLTVSATEWTHLSSKNGDLPAPPHNEATAALVFDIDKDGDNDFVIAGRQSPAMEWYRRDTNGWIKYAIEDGLLEIEAGGAFHDIDSDGDLDIVMGGDWRSNQVWWWENPYPNYNPGTPWTRREIKNSGSNKHHDQIFGDFDGDGQTELVFWNQNAHKLFLADIPSDPRATQPWPYVEIYSGSGEGLSKADIDGDGQIDLLVGGRWFKHNGGTNYAAYTIDDSQRESRIAGWVAGSRWSWYLVIVWAV